MDSCSGRVVRRVTRHGTAISRVGRDLMLLAGTLTSCCTGPIVLLLSRCSIPVTGTDSGKCCSRVLRVVGKVLDASLGSGTTLQFTIVAKYLQVTGRDVFAKAGGFMSSAVASYHLGRCFKFARGSMRRLLQSTSTVRRSGSLGF